MLPRRINRDECGVINTGQHWVAYWNSENRAEYFDPFGDYKFLGYRKSVPNEIINYLRSRDKAKKIVANTASVQHLNSQKCGCFVVLYIQLRQSGLSAEEALKQFTANASTYNEQLALSAL